MRANWVSVRAAIFTIAASSVSVRCWRASPVASVGAFSH
jgi:hypothetical protein